MKNVQRRKNAGGSGCTAIEKSAFRRIQMGKTPYDFEEQRREERPKTEKALEVLDVLMIESPYAKNSDGQSCFTILRTKT